VPLDPAVAIPTDALILLIGPAASGKTTWAAAHFRPTQLLSSDSFRELVADDASDQAASRDAFQLLHGAARARLARGLLTVIDATNLQRSARQPLLVLAARFGRPCVAVVFDVPLGVLLERNTRRSRAVPDDVIRRHHAQMSSAIDDIQAEGYRLVLP
jgi:protein phosphatase